jgi:flagellar biosynthesis/type III secretory pathway chaperone
MIQNLEQLIDALRHELQQYGEMLALLEAQQGCLGRAEAGPVLNSTVAVDAQRSVIERARNSRETFQKQLAWAMGCPDAVAYQDLLPRLPAAYQPLLAALVSEINQSIALVHGRARINHTLLHRAIEHTERLLTSISPQVQSALLAGERNPSGADHSQSTISAAIV